MKKFILIFAALVLGLATACSNTPADVAEVIDIREIEDIRLTISNPNEWMGLEHFAQMYMDKNPGVEIVLNSWDGDFMQYIEQKPLTLMAGTADDLIASPGFDYRAPSTQALLADWFPVMRADPHFNEDNFFINIFEAFASDGRLYNLPIAFNPTRVAYNTTIPGMAEEMFGRSNITMSEIHAIHRAFATENMFIDGSYDALLAVGSQMHSFIDFENRTASFNTPAFINFISESRELTHPDKNVGWMFASTYYSPEVMEENSHKYLFQQLMTGDPYQFLIPFEEEMKFSGRIPIANEHGEVLIHAFPSYVLNGRSSAETQAVAWDFIRFLLDPAIFQLDLEITPWVSMIPVYRPLLKFNLEQQIPSWMERFGENYGWRSAFSEEDTINYVYNQLSELGRIPVADRVYVPNSVSEIVQEVIMQFHDGLITAEQASEDLQNRVSLALMEI